MKFKNLLFLLAMLLPTFAMAGVYDPAPSSKAIQILASIFGELGTFGPSAGDPFKAVIEIFNGAVLVIGGILAGYTIIAGTLGTAHDGEMLGKKFSSLWVPIRTAMGTALILPALNGGYCVVQLIIGGLISQSVGFADTLWARYTSSEYIGQSLAVGLIRQDTKMLGYNILQSSVCLEALKKVTSSSEAEFLGGHLSKFGVTEITVGNNKVFQYGDTAELNGFTKTSCGSVSMPLTQETPNYPVRNGIWRTSETGFNSAQARMTTIIKEHETQLKSLMASMDSQAQSLVGGATLNPTAIDTLINNYELAVRKTATDQILKIDAFKEISQNASQDGFVGATMFYHKMNNLTDLIYRTMAKVPTGNPPNLNVNALYSDQYFKYYASLMKTISQTQRGQAFGISYEKGGSNNQMKEWSWVDVFSKDFDLNLALKSMFTDGRTSIVLEENEHPIMAMKRIGNYLLGLAGGGFASGMLMLVSIGNAPGVGLALQTTLNLFIPILWLGGFTLSFVFPSLPTLINISATLGWTIACIEAVIIGPVWIVMLLNPKGDDFVGATGQGFRLLLNLAFLPALIVFGNIASIVVSPIFGNFVSGFFLDTFISLNEESNVFILLTSMVGSCLIYGWFNFTLNKRIFNIITELPDTVMKWVTNSMHTLGNTSSQITGGSNINALVAPINKMGDATQPISNKMMKEMDKRERMTDRGTGGAGVDDGQKQGSDDHSTYSGSFKETASQMASKWRSEHPDTSNQKFDTSEKRYSEKQMNGPASSRQLNFMEHLSSKHNVPINEEDKSSFGKADLWLKNTLSEKEPQTFAKMMNRKSKMSE
ncbi:MAG: DotA/TraY family protein [Flavobacterium sp.]|nr:DotA/TraY family protein [Flavobacterium sp.]